MKHFFGSNKKDFIRALITSLTAGFITYYQVIVNGYMCPDGLCEGQYYYTNANWAAVCGRWGTRYAQMYSHYIIIPLIVVVIYCLCIALSALLLFDLWKIKTPFFQILMVAAMMTVPAVCAHMTFLYLAFVFAISELLTTFYIYFAGRDKVRYWIISVSALTFMLSMYQSYLGFAVCGVLMTAVLMLLRGEEIKKVLTVLLRYILCAFSAGILYFIIMKLEFIHYDLDANYLVNDFTVRGIFERFPRAVRDIYSDAYHYFTDSLLLRRWLYIGTILICGIFFLIICKHLIDEKKTVNAILSLVILTVFPLGMDFANILTSNEISRQMLFQYVFAFVIPAVLFDNFSDEIWLRSGKKTAQELTGEVSEPGKISGIVKKIMSGLLKPAVLVLGFIVLWTYVISANATFTCYKIGYDQIRTETAELLSDIHDQPGYWPGSSKIMCVGYIEDRTAMIHPELWTYCYQYSNAVFWPDTAGANRCWKGFLENYFNVGNYSYDEDFYNEVIASDEFKNMAIWPLEGSIKDFNGTFVVKLTDNPVAEESFE